MAKWLVSFVIISLLTAGCGKAANHESSPSSPSNEQYRAQQTKIVKKEIKDPTQVAAHLEQLAKGIEGVDNAHCVILGNTAIVGIDVKGNLERSRVGTIKYSVAEALHHDPYGVDALITADIDISNRLQEIGADIRNGRPVAGFAEEMADIIGRLVPQFPRDVKAPEATSNMNR